MANRSLPVLLCRPAITNLRRRRVSGPICARRLAWELFWRMSWQCLDAQTKSNMTVIVWHTVAPWDSVKWSGWEREWTNKPPHLHRHEQNTGRLKNKITKAHSMKWVEPVWAVLQKLHLPWGTACASKRQIWKDASSPRQLAEKYDQISTLAAETNGEEAHVWIRQSATHRFPVQIHHLQNGVAIPISTHCPLPSVSKAAPKQPQILCRTVPHTVHHITPILGCSSSNFKYPISSSQCTLHTRGCFTFHSTFWSAPSSTTKALSLWMERSVPCPGSILLGQALCGDTDRPSKGTAGENWQVGAEGKKEGTAEKVKMQNVTSTRYFLLNWGQGANGGLWL